MWEVGQGAGLLVGWFIYVVAWCDTDGEAVRDFELDECAGVT